MSSKESSNLRRFRTTELMDETGVLLEVSTGVIILLAPAGELSTLKSKTGVSKFLQSILRLPVEFGVHAALSEQLMIKVELQYNEQSKVYCLAIYFSY